LNLHHPASAISLIEVNESIATFIDATFHKNKRAAKSRFTLRKWPKACGCLLLARLALHEV